KFGWYLIPAVAAYLAKAPALIYPVILIAYAALFEKPAPGTRVPHWVRASLPALLVTGAAAIFSSLMTPRTFNAGATSATLYRLTQPWVALHYFVSFFLPTGLSADTDWGYVSSAWSAEALTGYVFAVALAFAGIAAARRRMTRPIAFGIAWFFLA